MGTLTSCVPMCLCMSTRSQVCSLHRVGATRALSRRDSLTSQRMYSAWALNQYSENSYVHSVNMHVYSDNQDAYRDNVYVYSKKRHVYIENSYRLKCPSPGLRVFGATFLYPNMVMRHVEGELEACRCS